MKKKPQKKKSNNAWIRQHIFIFINKIAPKKKWKYKSVKYTINKILNQQK